MMMMMINCWFVGTWRLCWWCWIPIIERPEYLCFQFQINSSTGDRELQLSCAGRLRSPSSHTPIPTSYRRWSASFVTRFSSLETTSSRRARSEPRCTSYRRESWTSSPRMEKWPPVCRMDLISEVNYIDNFVNITKCKCKLIYFL